MANFTKLHTAIVGAFKSAKAKAEKLENDSVTNQNKAISALVDAHILACTTTKAEYMKGTSVKNEAKGEVKALFDSLVADKYISKNTAQQYQQCFWIAFEKGIPFTRDLVNKKAAENAQANTPKTETPKAGPVEVTDMPALIATLQKALHQCTLLNQSMLKGALVDAIVEFIPEFTETAK
jgi:hypothetical protein